MPRLTAAEQVARNAAIVNARARGSSWAWIAERHGVSARRAQQVYAEAQREIRGTPRILEDELAEELALAESVIEDLAELAATTGNDAVRLGALKSKLQAQERRIELKQAMGVFPARLQALALAVYVERLRAAFEATVEELEASWPPGVLDRFLQRTQEAINADPALALPPMRRDLQQRRP